MFGIFFLLKKQQKRGGEEEKRKRKQKNLKQPGQSRSQRSRNFVNQQKLFRRLRTKQKKISAERGEKQKNFETQKKKKIDAYCILYFDANLFAKSIQIYPFPFKVSESFFSFHAFFSFFLSVVCFLFLSWIDRFGSLTES